MDKRYEFWDILKGIGIFSIVLGHCCPPAAIYVYSFHLALFFFTSAYFYNEDKYGRKPFLYVGNLLKNNWTKYVFYSTVLLLLQNFSVRFALDYGSNYLGIYEMFNSFATSFIFNSQIKFAGAMWFVLPNILSCALLCGLTGLSLRAVSPFKVKYSKFIRYAVMLLISGVLAYLAKTQLIFNIQVCFIVLPICVTAYIIKSLAGFEISEYLKIYIAVPLCALLYILVKYKNLQVELAQNIVPGIWFYVLSFCGIYVCMYLSKVLTKIPFISKVVAFCGKYSFSIMALHFLVIKLCDRVYTFAIGEKNPAIIGKWVCSYPEKLWPVYLIAGTIIPALAGYLFNKFKNYAQNNLPVCISTPTDE